MKALPLISCLLVLCQSAHATEGFYQTADQLALQCRVSIRIADVNPGPTVQDLVVGQECASYVMGALDTFEFIRATGGQKYPVQTLCVPMAVKSSEALRVFLKYSDDHPEELHLSAPLVIWDESRK